MLKYDFRKMTAPGILSRRQIMQRWLLKICFAIIFLAVGASAQVDEICGEAGFAPSLDSPFAHVPYVFGRVVLKGFDSGAKLPKVAVTLTDPQQPSKRLLVDMAEPKQMS